MKYGRDVCGKHYKGVRSDVMEEHKKHWEKEGRDRVVEESSIRKKEKERSNIIMTKDDGK